MEYFCAIVTSTVVELFIRHAIGYIEQGTYNRKIIHALRCCCMCLHAGSVPNNAAIEPLRSTTSHPSDKQLTYFPIPGYAMSLL